MSVFSSIVEFFKPSRKWHRRRKVNRALPVPVKTEDLTWEKTTDSNTTVNPDSESYRSPYHIPIILVSILLTCGILAIFILEPRDQTAQTTPVNPVPKPPEFPLPQEVAKDFLDEEDTAAKLAYCRHPEKTRLLIDNFPEQTKIKIPGLLRPLERQVTLEGTLISPFEFNYRDGSQRTIFVVDTPEGPKVDWPAFARHNSAPWESILNNQVDSAEVRMNLNSSNYYNFEYSDDSLWQAFNLESPDLDDQIVGYAKRGSLTARILARSKKDKPRVLLRLALNDSVVKHRQVEITEVLSLSWIQGEQSLQSLYEDESNE